MNRLTRKIKGYYSVDLRTCLPMEYEQIENSNACVDKLGKLEDIEEELGIDLIKAVEICKQANSKKVVYIKDEWGIYPIKILDILDVELASHRLYSNFRGIYVSLDLYEYGKTWALDKSDLVYDIVKKE